jgi:hypothetical protein
VIIAQIERRVGRAMLWDRSLGGATLVALLKTRAGRGLFASELRAPFKPVR